PQAAASRPKSLLSALSESPTNLPPPSVKDAQPPPAHDPVDQLFSELSDKTAAHKPLAPDEQVDQLFQEFGTQMLGHHSPIEPVEDTPVDDLVNRLLAEFGTGTLGKLPDEPPADEPPAGEPPAGEPPAEAAQASEESFTQED